MINQEIIAMLIFFSLIASVIYAILWTNEDMHGRIKK